MGANFNFNKVIIGGRLTADVDLKQTPSGISVAQFSVAVNRKGKDAQTDFIDCVAWRQTAEFISRYFSKGSSICIVGSLQKREWTDKNGQKRYATEVIADEACFVESKNDAVNVESAKDKASTDVAYTPEEDDDSLPF